jgi:hypothetical protein
MSMPITTERVYPPRKPQRITKVNYRTARALRARLYLGSHVMRRRLARRVLPW